MRGGRRLDVLLSEKYEDISRTRAAELICAGKALVNGVSVKNPSAVVPPGSSIELLVFDSKYVSRAGLKLEFALDRFGLDVHGFIALDSGLSTGGFSDCLLQRGAKKVFGVDVGHGQVHRRLKGNPRLVIFEKTDLRNLASLPELVDLITLDLSFISVLKVIDSAVALLKPRGKVISLIKPQFEVGKEFVGRGGIVKSEGARLRAVQKVEAKMGKLGLFCSGIHEVPQVAEGRYNVEYMGLFSS